MPIPSQPTTNISLGPTLSPTDRSISDEFTELPSTDYAPYSISQYYRGAGAASPSYLKGVADHPINASIPTSGPISFSQFNGGSIVLKYVITSSTQNLNLFDYASSALRPTATNFDRGYYQGTRYVANQPGYGIEFVINPGVVVGSATTAQNALVTGTDGPTGWHPSIKIVLKNQGQIVGTGGAGGRGALNPATPPGAAGSGAGGGTAVVAQRPIVIQNQGTIGGGGGGGGGGSYTFAFPDTWPGGGGGGGAGQTVGAGGQAGTGGSGAGLAGGTAGSPGTLTTGGAGGTKQPQAPVPIKETAGSGGPLGTVGQAGPALAGSLGGANGFFAKGTTNITWQELGTVAGQSQPTV